MGFELPPGDPGAVLGALRTVATVSGDLKSQEATTRSGFAQALGTWHGPRADDFRAASAGIQLQVSEAQSTLDKAISDLDGYARVLRSAIEEIKSLEGQANTRQSNTDADTRGQPPDSTQVTQAQQHCAQFIAHLEQQAEEQRTRVRRAAHGVVGVLDVGAALAVPGAEKLSPAEIARKVHASTGVDGLDQAMASGTLSAPQAWGALANPAKALKPEEINDDGSIDWKQLGEDVREAEAENPLKKLLDGSLDAWALATAPTGGWALAKLAAAARGFALAKAALPIDVFRLSQAELDSGRIVSSVDEMLNTVTNGLKLSETDVAAFQAEAGLSRAAENVVSSGLPEILDGTAGKLFMGLGFLGDAWTLADPNAAKDDKWDAGLNAAGLAMTTETGSTLVAGGLEASGLLAADAAVGWVPVVGWGLVAITAGYEVYKHWDTVKGWGKDAWHGAEWLSQKEQQAVTYVADKTWDGTKWVAGKTWDGLSSAAGATEDGISSAASATKNFVSDHIPDVHLW